MKDPVSDPLKGKCPLRGCRALFLGWTRQLAPETTVSYHCCPPCDATFLVVDERSSGGYLQVLRGTAEEETRLTQHPPDAYQHMRLPDRDVTIHRGELAAAVRRFNASRMATKTVRCAGNHGPAALMSQWGIMMERSLYLSGCDVCLIAHVQARDRAYGWELAISFVFDVGVGAWALRELHRPSMDPGVVSTCLAMLDRLRSDYDMDTRSFLNRSWGLV